MILGAVGTQVQRILTAHGRGDDYVEIGLDSPYCYNALHNDLEPYALAYSIATLLNNLYGRGKEPFWQQAYTDLVKFLILLRKVVDGYTTLAEIYHYAIDESLIDGTSNAGSSNSPRRRRTSVSLPTTTISRSTAAPGRRGARPQTGSLTHPLREDLIAFLQTEQIAHTVYGDTPALSDADRQLQLAVVKRWRSRRYVNCLLATLPANRLGCARV